MRKIKLCFCMLVAAVLSSSSSLFAQDWVKMMQDPNVNFFDVQKAFNKYAEKAEREMQRENKKASRKLKVVLGEEESEIPGEAQFRRWEWFMSKRVLANGERVNPSQVWNDLTSYREHISPNTVAGTWTFIGPSNTSNLMGAGRLNFVRIHPFDPNTLFVGSPSGGLWKTTDGGASWSTNTDLVAQVIGCSDLAIDPSNPDVMYLATGDATGAIGEPYTVGVLKTIDGGNTWNTTGLSFYLATYRQVSAVVINPSNTNTIIATTTAGIFRSTDGGTSFSLVQAGSFKDVEFKPNDPNTVYASGNEFYRSMDGGQTWTKITSGLPAATAVGRIAIAVTPADQNIIYLAIGAPAPNYGLVGFYKSTNGGTSFSSISNPADGNQQWYDLCMAASPTNAQEVMLGQQTGFKKSTNGGGSWSTIAGSTHVDYHDVVYATPTTIYITSDGGIFKSTNSGASWSDLSSNLAISEMYGFGQSTTNANILVNGWQDNDINTLNGTTWSSWFTGADGMLAFVSWANDNNMWGSNQYGALRRSTNGGASSQSALSGINEYTGDATGGSWVVPWKEDPVAASTLWAGFKNVWKSTNGGQSWTKKSTFSTSLTLNALDISPADNNVVWAANNGALYKTSNGGTNWTTITTVPAGTIADIACSNTDPNKAWIVYGGFNASIKVFQTNDQGATWINLSGSMPNIPMNCIAYLNNSNDVLYVGTDVGAFYKDASFNVWQPFSSGLPNAIVTQLEIFYPGNKIRASTFGRGMWESDLYQPGNYPPSAYFGSNQNISCAGAAMQFTDYSAGVPTSWDWQFPGGSPSSSTQQNPIIYYNTPGTYSVTLTATNANGTSAYTMNNFITISNSPYPNPSTVGDMRCGPGIVNLSATGTGNGTLRWWDAPGGGNVVNTGNSYSPFINATTTYYVDEDFPPGALDFTGAFATNIGAGAFFTANDIRGLYFDVLDPVIINTVDVFSNSAGNRTIEIIDPQGNTYIDTTVFIPATSQTTPYTVTLNFPVYPGNNYFIKCRGYVDLFRNTAGAVYPYTSTSVNITNSNAGSPGYYYFFYNWTYTSITCNTGRTGVTGADTCSSTGINDIITNGSLSIFPNPNNGTFNLSFNTSAKDNYTVKITNALGQNVFEEKLESFTGLYSRIIDIRKQSKGVYILSIENSENETVKKIVVY